MTVEAFDKGDRIRFAVEFKDGETDVASDPTAVTFRLRLLPAGEPIVKTLAAAQVIRDGAGLYHFDADIDASGDWAWRWEGTGALVAASEGTFFTRKSNF